MYFYSKFYIVQLSLPQMKLRGHSQVVSAPDPFIVRFPVTTSYPKGQTDRHYTGLRAGVHDTGR